MQRIFLTVMLTIGLIGAAHAAGDATAGKAKAGACAACHGADGNSPAPNFPKLAGQGERYLLKQMQEIKSGSRAAPLMAGQLDSQSEQDMADIAAYFSAQKGTVGAAKADLVKMGEELYRAGSKRKNAAACGACHSPTGQGNALAGFPRLSGQHAEYTAAQLQAFRSGTRNNDAERIMRDNAELLSDAEIEAVASYISGLHP